MPLREAHPDDVPCIERFDEDDVDVPVADWRRGVVADDQGIG
jgi:hypothetical protein